MMHDSQDQSANACHATSSIHAFYLIVSWTYDAREWPESSALPSHFFEAKTVKYHLHHQSAAIACAACLAKVFFVDFSHSRPVLTNTTYDAAPA